MKFGQVADPSGIQFKLPQDPAATTAILAKTKSKVLEVYVGCAKWNKTDLKGFYPNDIKDELTYYGKQFNSIELNATFYNMPTVAQVVKWKEKTPKDFKFFPKLTNSISHYKRLTPDSYPVAEAFCNAVSNFEEKLGMVFLQLHDKFSPKEFEKLTHFLDHFPKGIPLAVEVRNENWFANPLHWSAFCNLLQKKKIANIIVDTPGRRDMVHMRLTTAEAFVRFVGCNDDAIDKKRLDDWLQRVKKWQTDGLKRLYFFVHQNIEVSSPLLSGYFIEKLNALLGLSLHTPQIANYRNTQKSFFDNV